MRFTEARFKGVYIVELEPHADSRGFFSRAWCQNEFQGQGLSTRMVQCNISFNHRKGTWRGMHYQIAPSEEAKLVRCTMGSVCDIIVDLRVDSPTYREHLTVELSASNRRMVYIPEKFAHGFLTLEDNTEVFYQMSEFYAKDCERGFRWNDPFFDIQLPATVEVISERDRDYPFYQNQT